MRYRAHQSTIVRLACLKRFDALIGMTSVLETIATIIARGFIDGGYANTVEG